MYSYHFYIFIRTFSSRHIIENFLIRLRGFQGRVRTRTVLRRAVPSLGPLFLIRILNRKHQNQFGNHLFIIKEEPSLFFDKHIDSNYNGKMQNKFPDNDNFSIFHWFLHFMFVPMVQKSSLKVIFGQIETWLRKSNSRPKVFKFLSPKLFDFQLSESDETLPVKYLRFKPRSDIEFGRR